MNGGPQPDLVLIALLDVFTLDDDQAVRSRVIDSAAESFQAEIVGIICDGSVIQAIGVGACPELNTALIAAAESDEKLATFPELGELHVASLPIDGRSATRFTLARSSGPFEHDELQVCRAMIRVMRLAVRTLWAFDEEREISRRLEREVSRNRELASELHERHSDLMARMLDLQNKLSTSAGSVLESIVEQGQALFAGGIIAIHLLGPNGDLELRHLSEEAPESLRLALENLAQHEGLPGRAIDEDQLATTGEISAEQNAAGQLDTASALEHSDEHGLTMGMSAPVHQQERAIGAVTIHSPSRPAYTRAERETVLLLAGYATAALGDAKIIDERQQALEAAEWQATHDPLTGLANRRLVLDEMAEHLAVGHELFVLYFDVDRFKSVNDLYGHRVGDQLIIMLAERLQALTRPGDLAGRLAGDEFVLVGLADPESQDSGSALAERLGRELSEPAVIDGRTIKLTVSIGLATSEGLTSADDLINVADVAMYQAKSSGRNTTGLFDEELQNWIRRRAALADHLTNALADGDGFHLEYQPIVDIRTQSVCGHEALLRFDDPVLGNVAPDEFIPLAEEVGIITAIDNWVLTTALAEASAAGVETTLSVNVSPAWLTDPRSVDHLVETADAAGFPLDRLSLEVTERAAIAEAVSEPLRLLRELGVKILLDDFGTGYSSLAYVRTLEIDGIKIDRGFLDGVERDRHTAAVLEAVVTLTDRLGAMAIAEGVESAAQAEVLASLGCRLAQGFYFGRPTPAPAGFTSQRVVA